MQLSCQRFAQCLERDRENNFDESPTGARVGGTLAAGTKALEPPSRRLDVLHTQIHLGLPAVMGHVRERIP